MTALSQALRNRAVFIEVPDVVDADWVPLLEVLVQEGFEAWALPLTRLDEFSGLLRLYRRRAAVGVYGAHSAEDVSRAVQAGAHFVTSPVASADLVAAGGDCPVIVGALTPTEIVAAAGIGATAVQVIPAEAVAGHYAQMLSTMVAGIPLVATGQLQPSHVSEWLTAGASAVGVSMQGVAEYLVGNFDELRRWCQGYSEFVA